MATFVYNSFKAGMMSGLLNLATANLRVGLVTSTYTPDPDGDRTYSDIAGEVAAGNGYSVGGELLTNVAVTTDLDNDYSMLDADNVTWSTSSITASGAFVYASGTHSPYTHPLIAYIDFGQNQTSNNGDFSIEWASGGIIKLQNG